MITSSDGTPARCLGLAARPGQDARCVALAFDRGVNYYFTYGPGHVEFVGALRRLAQAKRDEIIVATGCGSRAVKPLAAARRRLCKAIGVDVIDVFFIEYLQPHEPLETILGDGGTLDEVRRWKEQGDVRFVGVSVHDRTIACRLAQDPRVDLLMHRFNLAHRKAAREVFPAAQRARTPVVAFTATRWGTLLEPLPESTLKPPSAVECYRYCLSQPAVKIVLSAPSSPKELKENLTVLDAPRMTRREQTAWERYGDIVYGDGKHAYETRWL